MLEIVSSALFACAGHGMNFRNTLDWLKNRDLFLLLTATVLALGIYGFVQLSDVVTEGKTQSFDERVLKALRKPETSYQQPIGPDWVEEVGRDLTALGGVAVMALLSVSVAAYLGLVKRWRALVILVLTVGGGMVLNIALKDHFDRPRPTVVPQLSKIYTSSYPSGHSLLSAVTYLTLGALLASVAPQRRQKTYFLALAVLLTLLVGMSRVLMGVHYPTDVLAGWSAGFLWATACWIVMRVFRKRHGIETHPAGR